MQFLLSRRRQFPDRIADLVIRCNLQDRILFSSFHPLNLLRIRRRLPGAPVAMLTEAGNRGRLYRGWFGRHFAPRFLHPYFSDVDSTSLEAEHRRNRRVNTWTVNDPEDMRTLYKSGIDGIITDDPQIARQVLEER